MLKKSDLVKVEDWLWEIPRSYRSDMRVPARVYATEEALDAILGDRSLEQLVNVAALPGIVGYALAMPDVHQGYGFPVGGVAAFDIEEGIISPGGVGYDINCGVRLLSSKEPLSSVKPHLEELGRAIFREVPSGVGRGGRLQLKGKDLDRVLEGGARELVAMGYGEEEDLPRMESRGYLADADADLVSERAKSRGRDQVGTMGAGNHFVEVDVVETVFDAEEAARLGLFKDQVVVLIHTGSRGMGHQVATDYIRLMMKALPKHKITLADRELACGPFQSPEGQRYFGAMSAAANFAWANRELITWEVRKAWRDVLGEGAGPLRVLYDVAHNIAKVEEYTVGGRTRKVVVHRKGATRSFPGQPVLIPGSMGTGSYLLVGTERAMEETFGSSCHGAGRRMSRTQARREVQGAELKAKLSSRGIVVNAGSLRGLAEEAPEAYKDVDGVVDVVHQAQVARRVVRVRPVAVIKG
jgi:tRNA-splicing ligase RtcB